ncbi:hypothetical protein N7457_004528 [Penicillium paradoxum]|uniref:uncharacterized protein n=1 Tax=Penicillium paradoxum TaxID=176176 RepID=UPI00254934CD|nr:uncharacterized protein N7457_004528 [Penicillium paradoxum]KAJ5782754.1 hypothetical protein N7457_004528 [Penicillium paradoxum]
MPARPHILASRKTRSSIAKLGVHLGKSISHCPARRGICEWRGANACARFGSELQYVSLPNPSPSSTCLSTPPLKRNFSNTTRKSASIWDEDDDVPESSPVQPVPGRPVRTRPTAHRDLGSLVRSRVAGSKRMSQRAELEKIFNSLDPFHVLLETFIQLKYKHLDGFLMDCIEANQAYRAEFNVLSSILQKRSDDAISWITKQVLEVERIYQECMTEWATLSKCIQARLLAVVPQNTERVLRAEATTQKYIAEVIRLSNSILGLDRMQAAVTQIESTGRLIEDDFCRIVFAETPEWTRKLKRFDQDIRHLQKSLLAAQVSILHRLIATSELSIDKLRNTLNNKYLRPREAARSRIDQIITQTIQINEAYTKLQLQMQSKSSNTPIAGIRYLCLSLQHSPGLHPKDRFVFGQLRDTINRYHNMMLVLAHQYRAYWFRRQMASHPLRESELWSLRDLTDRPELGRLLSGDEARVISALALNAPRKSKKISYFQKRAHEITLYLRRKYKALWTPRPARSPKLHIYWRQLDALGPLNITELSLWDLHNEAWYLHYSLRGDHGRLWAWVSEKTMARTIDKLSQWCTEVQAHRNQLLRLSIDYRHLNWMRLRSETILHSMGEPAYLAGKFEVPNPMSQNISRFKEWTHSMGQTCSDAYMIKIAQRVNRTQWEHIYEKMALVDGPQTRILGLGSSMTKRPNRKRGRRQSKYSRKTSMRWPWKDHVRYSKATLWSHSRPPLILDNKKSKTLGEMTSKPGLPVSHGNQEDRTLMKGKKTRESPKFRASQLMVGPNANNGSQSGSKSEHSPSTKLWGKSKGVAVDKQRQSNRSAVDVSADEETQKLEQSLKKKAKMKARALLQLGVELHSVRIIADAANILLELKIGLTKVNPGPRAPSPNRSGESRKKRTLASTRSAKQRSKASSFLADRNSGSNPFPDYVPLAQNYQDGQKTEKVPHGSPNKIWGKAGNKFATERQQKPIAFPFKAPLNQGETDFRETSAAVHNSSNNLWGRAGKKSTTEHQPNQTLFPSGAPPSRDDEDIRETEKAVLGSLNKLWGEVGKKFAEECQPNPAPLPSKTPPTQDAEDGREKTQAVHESLNKLWGKAIGTLTEEHQPCPSSASASQDDDNSQAREQIFHDSSTKLSENAATIEPEPKFTGSYLDNSSSASPSKNSNPHGVAQEAQHMFRSRSSESVPLQSSIVQSESHSSAEIDALQKREAAEDAFDALFVKRPPPIVPTRISNPSPGRTSRNDLRANTTPVRGPHLHSRGISRRTYSKNAYFYQTKLRQSSTDSGDPLSEQPVEHDMPSVPDAKHSRGPAYLEGNFFTDETVPSSEIESSAKNFATPEFWSHSSQKSPDGQKLIVHYCRTLQSTEETVQLFHGSKVIGFDMEWKAQASARDSIQSNVSVIQIANEERIALFQVALFKPSHSLADLVSPSLKRLIESPDVMKVGVSIKADCTRLRKYLGIDARATFELSHLFKLVKYGRDNPKLVNKRGVNLSEQVREHFGLPLEKSDDVRCGDWARPLNYRQVQYAATDPYACIRLFYAMDAKRQAIDPTPPRPAYAELNQPIILPLGQKINDEGNQPLI